jgi:hypothetical protein
MKTRLLVALISLGGAACAQEPRPLFENGDQAVTFKLKDKNGKTPHLLLFDAPDQAPTADSINYWRDTPNPKEDGVAVDFKGIRFLRSPENPDDLAVRLVGIKNELELGETVSLDELQSGRPQKLHFGPTTMGTWPITGTTDAEMTLSYDPKRRTLEIPEIAGQFAWKRPFYDAQADAGSLRDVTGEIGNVPRGGVILKPDSK